MKKYHRVDDVSINFLSPLRLSPFPPEESLPQARKGRASKGLFLLHAGRQEQKMPVLYPLQGDCVGAVDQKSDHHAEMEANVIILPKKMINHRCDDLYAAWPGPGYNHLGVRLLSGYEAGFLLPVWYRLFLWVA